MIVALWLACTSADPEPSAGHRGTADAIEDTASGSLPRARLDDAAWLRRVSFDLRGVPPTTAELDELNDDPSLAPNLRDAMMHSARFESRMVNALAERWHTRVDEFDIVAFDYGLPSSAEYEFERAVGEEPLRLLARIIATDRPWTDAVLADWTMATPLLGEIWPIDYPSGESGWQPARYTDGRPSAGVLSTNGLWWRYTTTDSNMNRGRAAAISRLLLCEDYLIRPVAFSEADTSGTTTADAAQEDPYCLACHSSLDPIAASLFGFWWMSLYSRIEETTYHPEREALWEQYLGVSPGWYGEPISGLSQLGPSIANDSRFFSCAVESMAEFVWRRPVTADDSDAIESLRRGFLEGGAVVRPLIGALTEADAYHDAEPRMMTHDQFADTVEALTGFRWTHEGYDMLDTDRLGHRLLLGGVDGIANRAPQDRPGLTWALVVKRTAEAAASHAVERELVDGGERRLFRFVTLDTVPDDDDFERELRGFHRGFYSRDAPDEWVDEMRELWSALAAIGTPPEAWRATVSVMIRDPAFLTH